MDIPAWIEGSVDAPKLRVDVGAVRLEKARDEESREVVAADEIAATIEVRERLDMGRHDPAHSNVSAIQDAVAVGDVVELVAEPTNEHDAHAVMVVVGGVRVAYVPRTYNKRVRPGPATIVAVAANPLDWTLECHQASRALELGDDWTLGAKFVEVKSPNDSFGGRTEQLIWQKALREAGVDARVCRVKEPT